MMKKLVLFAVALALSSGCGLLKSKPTLKQKNRLAGYVAVEDSSFRVENLHKLEKFAAEGYSYDDFFQFKADLYKSAKVGDLQDQELKKVEKFYTTRVDKWVLGKLQRDLDRLSTTRERYDKRKAELAYIIKVVPFCKAVLVSKGDEARLARFTEIAKKAAALIVAVDEQKMQAAKRSEQRRLKSIEETQPSPNVVKGRKFKSYEKLARSKFHYSGKILKIVVAKDWYRKTGDSLNTYLDVEYGVKSGEKCYRYIKRFRKSPNGAIEEGGLPKFRSGKQEMKCENVPK